MSASGGARRVASMLCVALLAGWAGAVAANATPATAGQWSPTVAGTLSEREDPAVAADPKTGSLVLFGGDNSNNVQADTWLFDGKTWTRAHPAHVPGGRTGASLAYFPPTGTDLLFGGDSHNTAVGDYGSTWSWNGTDWSLLVPTGSPSAPPARLDASMAYDPDNRTLIMFGGQAPDGVLDDTWSWNGSGWTKLVPATAPSARYGAGLAYDSVTHQLVLFGGMGVQPGGTFGELGDTWTFNGRTWTQQTTLTSPSPRLAPALAPAPGGGLVLFGGYSGNGVPSVVHQSLLPPGQFDSDTWTWGAAGWTRQSAAGPPARYQAGAAYYPGSHRTVVVAGCCNSAGGFLTDTWEFDGAGWSQVTRSDAPSPRSGAAAVYDSARRQVLLFGGYGGDGFLADTWTYGPTGWSQQTPGNSPPGRFAAGIAFDSRRGQVVLYGGQGDSAYGCTHSLNPPTNPNHLCDDTWTWNGSTWTQVVSTAFPSRRSLAAMAYDPATDQTVLFGGFADLATYGDTWIWNGTSWGQAHPAVSPSVRAGAMLAYDPAIGELVLFGGEGYDASGNPASLSDTWAWNGSDWRQLSPATAPPPRYEGDLTYDPQLGELLLYGGQGSGFSWSSDTWAFDGRTWRPVDTPTSPPARTFASFTGGLAGGDVLFGGQGSDGFLSDTWTLSLATPAGSVPESSWPVLLVVISAGALWLVRRPGDPLRRVRWLSGSASSGPISG